jgi:hypothetical protein
MMQHPGEFFSLKNKFGQLLDTAWRAVTDEEFRNVYDRFTYIRQDNDGLFHRTDKMGETSGSWTLTRGNMQEVIGQIREDGHIYNQLGELVARRVGQFNSFHDYTVGCLFAGIWSEFICQMPKQYRNSPHQYYFRYEMIEDRYETHYVTMILYQRVMEMEHPMEVAVPDQTEETESLCMVCFEQQASTTVMPCGHHVVCRQCSRQLQRTNDHNTCVRCRRPIESIIEDPTFVVHNDYSI